jgi:hypothetical protein
MYFHSKDPSQFLPLAGKYARFFKPANLTIQHSIPQEGTYRRQPIMLEFASADKPITSIKKQDDQNEKR